MSIKLHECDHCEKRFISEGALSRHRGQVRREEQKRGEKLPSHEEMWALVPFARKSSNSKADQPRLHVPKGSGVLCLSTKVYGQWQEAYEINWPKECAKWCKLCKREIAKQND